MDLLLPRTDRGVAVQAVFAAVVFAIAVFAVRGDRDLRLFVGGLGMLAAAWFGIRAIH